jgi:hypothetical protein
MKYSYFSNGVPLRAPFFLFTTDYSTWPRSMISPLAGTTPRLYLQDIWLAA